MPDDWTAVERRIEELPEGPERQELERALQRERQVRDYLDRGRPDVGADPKRNPGGECG